jgi:hypothetical protein
MLYCLVPETSFPEAMTSKVSEFTWKSDQYIKWDIVMLALTLQKLQSSSLTPELLHAWHPVPSPGSPEHLILRFLQRPHYAHKLVSNISLRNQLCILTATAMRRLACPPAVSGSSGSCIDVWEGTRPA